MQESLFSDKRLLQVGNLVSGRYEVEEFVGEGAFGEVFRAKDLQSQPIRTVALKVLRQAGNDHGLPQRFVKRELTLLTRIQQTGGSANVVGVIEPRVGDHQGNMYLVLEFVEGPSFKDWLEEKHPVPISDALRIAAGLARGLSAIHAASGVHRDLKPSNIRLRHGKVPVILDVGIARGLWDTETLTATGGGPMTMRYASPEQLEGRRVDPASDIYAFGLILYEMLCGQVPLVGKTLGETLRRRTTEKPLPASAVRKDVPQGLAKLITDCLEFDPRRRPSSPHIIKRLTSGMGADVTTQWSWIVATCIPLTFLGDVAIVMTTTQCTARNDEILAVAYRKSVQQSVPAIDLYRRCQEGGMAEPVRFEAPIADSIGMYTYPIGPGVVGFATTSAESCHRYRLRLERSGRSSVDIEDPSCSVDENFWWGTIVGDADNDGNLDFVSIRRVRGSAERPSVREGWTMLAGATAFGRLVKQSFHLDFEPYRLGTAQRLGKVDGDACADLVMFSYATGGASPTAIHLFAGNCAGQFAPVVGTPGTTLPGHIATLPAPANAADMADLDRDGFVDLVIGGDDDGDPGQFWILRGNGHGFNAPHEAFDVMPEIEVGADQPGTSNSCVLIDWNDDGHLDAVVNHSLVASGVQNDATRFVVFLGSGDGSFKRDAVKIMDAPPKSNGFILAPWHI